MYKKKLGVRVVTAITVGSLLCSNASVAMAAEEVSSILKEHDADTILDEDAEEEIQEATSSNAKVMSKKQKRNFVNNKKENVTIAVITINSDEYEFTTDSSEVTETDFGYVIDMSEIRAELESQGYDVTAISDTYTVTFDEVNNGGRLIDVKIEKSTILTVIINGEEYTFDKETAPFDDNHNGYVADMTDIKAALAEQGYDVTSISDVIVVTEDEVGRVVELTVEKSAILTVIINGEKYTFDKETAPFDDNHNGYVADMIR